MFNIKTNWMKKNKNSAQEELTNENAQNEEMEDVLNDEQDEEQETEPAEEEEEEVVEVDELEELRDKYLRLAAEFDNYRKRTAKEKVELIQTAEKGLLLAMLEVLDDADRASVEIEKSEDLVSVKEGAFLIFDKLRKKLTSRGLKEMDSVNQDYDPELQEAIAEVPAPSEELKGKVIDDVQKGYYLNDKLIRHAKVVVGK